MAAATCDAPFEGKRGHRNFPAFIEWSNDVVLRYLDVIEEHFVEMMMAVHHDQRTDLNAGSLHVVEQQIAYSLVLRRVRIGARKQEHPVRELRARGPHLLPIDDEVIAFEFSPSLKAGKVGA